jgi:hypothetical protein
MRSLPARTEGCWEWKKWITGKGYGRIKVGGKLMLAHRHFYEMAKGPIPTGLQIDHKCRNRSCVNPEHLEVVTNEVNTQRGESASLDPATVAIMIAFREEGLSLRELSGIFGVSLSTASRTCNGKTWKNEYLMEA